MSEPSRKLDPAQIARRAQHVIFCVDCSGSMAGDRIEAVNEALRSTIPALHAATQSARVEIVVRILTFADKPEWRAAPTDARSQLVAGGESNMGLALRALGDALLPARETNSQAPTTVILISDGLPTDDGEAGLAAFARSPLGRDAQRLAIAIGADADFGLLQGFVAGAGLPLLRAHNPQALRHQIEWCASALVEAAASPTSAAVQKLAAEAAKRNASIGDTLW